MSLLAKHIGHKRILSRLPSEPSPRKSLVSLLESANKTVPFYKGRFENFLKNHAQASDEIFWIEFSKLPFVTKQDLKSHNADFLDERFAGFGDLLGAEPSSLLNMLNRLIIKKDFKISISTGGTSGMPTYRWLDHADANVMAQSFLESFHMNGWRRGESFVVFYPMRSYFTDTYAAFNNTLHKLFGFSVVPFETITLETVQELLSSLKKRQASLLVIFPCVLQRVAEIMRQHNIPPVRDLPYINVSGEFFLDCSKSFIREMFPNSDIQMTYGAVEIGEVAHQFGPSSFDYEVFRDFAHIEESPQDSILVTSLRQKAFPMIRYQMEDKGQVQSDETGRQFLLNLEGKNTDFLVGADGHKYYASFFNHMVNKLNEEFGYPIIHFMLRHDAQTLQINFVLRDENVPLQRKIEKACVPLLSRTFPQFHKIEIHFPDHFAHDYTRKFKIIGEGDGLAEVVGGYFKKQA
jgi:phenylacetate-coenzyme A ligase PaaK-like adenylate-forming protein